jgi:hypothetical protein
MIQGQDWSGYQAEEPDVTGLSFAFTKITEGLSYLNPRWIKQRDWAKSQGLVWGAYHYPHMANDPAKEADYFLRQVSWAPGDIIVLDWEGYDNANVGVSNTRKLAYRDAWLKYVKGKMPNHRVGMYCNTDYWLNLDKTSNCGDFLWIADYTTAGQPRIKAKWLFHQFSASPVDRDVCKFNTKAELQAWAGATSAPSGGDPMTISKADAAEVAAAVWEYQQDDPTRPGTQYMKVKDVLWWIGAHSSQSAVQITALSATVTALTAQLGKNVDTPTVVAAVQKAIADAVVEVNVQVSDKTAPAGGTTA